jgi:hypothetical protein
MPTTVLVTIDLRGKPGRFDRLVAEQTVAWRASRNVVRHPTLRRGTEPEHTVPDVRRCSRDRRALRVRIAPSGCRPTNATTLVTVAAAQRGGPAARRARAPASYSEPGPGSIARLPRYLVGVLANLSGLGDETLRWRSESFRPADLPAGP